MSEEDEWSVNTLFAHLSAIMAERDARYQQHFADLEVALRAALQASDRAIEKAERATERRFESVNEFRQTISDQATGFMSRAEAIAQHDRNVERIQDLTDRINRYEGKGAGISASVAMIIGVVTVIIAIVTVVLMTI